MKNLPSTTYHLQSIKGFSIIEVLVGIFIFSLWLVSIFLLLTSSLNVNELNKNKIIASNLSREQIELFRNIRDTNYATLHWWSQINPEGSTTDVFEAGKYYILENNFSSWFSVSTQEISDFWEGISELSGKMQDYRLYLTPEWVYTYDTTSWNIPTHFYRFLEISAVEYNNGGTITQIPSAYKITSKVIWYKRWYHEMQIDTVVADWRRI